MFDRQFVNKARGVTAIDRFMSIFLDAAMLSGAVVAHRLAAVPLQLITISTVNLSELSPLRTLLSLATFKLTKGYGIS